jgi:hypothetical protein
VARARSTPPAHIATLADALEYAAPRPTLDASSGAKSAYAARFSNALAVLVAGQLEPDFPGILPTREGRHVESKARTAKGFKKLDVNYSTLELGLGLGISIKTINYRDGTTQRYTKNYTARDNELRAEAIDYHQRQPYSILVGLLVLPFDSCDDAGGGTTWEAGISSFGAAVRHFRRNRVLRLQPDDPLELFEGFFVGLYEHEGLEAGSLVFFDVMDKPPRDRRPTADEVMTLDEVVTCIRTIYDSRNNPPFEWAP